MVNVTPHVYDVTNPNGKKITSNTLTVLTIFRHHLKYRFMCEPDKLYQGVVCYNSLQTFWIYPSTFVIGFGFPRTFEPDMVTKNWSPLKTVSPL